MHFSGKIQGWLLLGTGGEYTERKNGTYLAAGSAGVGRSLRDQGCDELYKV